MDCNFYSLISFALLHLGLPAIPSVRDYMTKESHKRMVPSNVPSKGLLRTDDRYVMKQAMVAYERAQTDPVALTPPPLVRHAVTTVYASCTRPRL